MTDVNDKQVSDTWERGNPYEQYVGRWSRRVAPLFLSWLGLPAGLRWLDVGCGTVRSARRSWTAVSVFGRRRRTFGGVSQDREGKSANRAALYQGSATAIPLPDAAVDVVVSGLVLNFVPDQPAALLEMGRVTCRGGTIAAYVWDYAGKMELIRFFWDAAIEADPEAAKLDEGVRFPLCRPPALERLFGAPDWKESR